jgi:alkylresorcinol/alkylpyrone synthase
MSEMPLTHSDAAPIRLASLATAVPPHILDQEEVERRAADLFGERPEAFARFAPVYRNAGISTRHSSVPVDWYFADHDAGERAALYGEAAVALMEEAAREALADAGIEAGDVDAIVAVSSTGVATPSLDARLMARMDFRRDVVRLPIFGLGCAGGVLGLSRATALARAMPGARVLLVVAELCGLTFRRHDSSKSNRVATALFGDGAAAAIVTTDGEGPRLGGAGEHTWPDTLDVMGWEVVGDGLKVVFSRDIPHLVRTELLPVAERFLGMHGLDLNAMDGFVCHPGGAKVIDALEDVFGVQRGGLVHARAVLRDHGNMSAPTVLFVLKAAMEAGARGRHLMTAMGPGFTAGFQMIELG